MDDPKSFEEALKRLETIVAELESGELTLDESLAKYETGVKMYKLCHELLQRAEERVQMLLKDSEGGFVVQNMDKSIASGDES